ncbi:MAG: class I SAM-dependent rRNA methyltransferase [Deltaproteobacteria bacterium]|nr:class I SAM-dependent rRNA methyltransferase [Deltaproteobacteria bacterium]
MNAKIKITDRCAKRLKAGHLWVYDNEIAGITGGALTDGADADFVDSRGKFIARGYVNRKSKIAGRVLTFRPEDTGEKFLKTRIEASIKRRADLGYDVLKGTYRVVFSEGDLLPGLIVDKYKDVVVIQLLSLGMDVRRSAIVKILKDIFSPAAIIEKSDSSVREKEGLKTVKEVVYGTLPSPLILETDGVSFEVDPLEGQKTGFYLDQAENRRVIEPYVKNKRVLDAFTNTGSFAIYAVNYNATSVDAVEDSKKAFEGLKRNVALNKMDSAINCLRADSFDLLREKAAAGEKYGAVILDPPSFLKTKDRREGALRGYKDINLYGLKLLEDGGFLITASCSHNVTLGAFLDVLNDAASDADSLLDILEMRTQSKDHPVLLSMPETHYLKFVIARKMGR